MVRSVQHLIRLGRAAQVLAAHRAALPDLNGRVRTGTDQNSGEQAGRRLAKALTQLGPSYIKFGQVLATRSDMVGPHVARGLSELHDRMGPFSDREARATIEAAFGEPARQVYADFGPPIAAASIAQVHKAAVRDGEAHRDVAVKILRPGIERRFRHDLDSFYAGARLVERLRPSMRRLRPVELVRTLDESVQAELDLRIEAAAAEEMGRNTAQDEDFRVPKIDWQRTAQRVMTSEWIDGIPLNDREALVAAGYDLTALARSVLQNFLRHAVRDGLFHADMHPGNLFADRDGRLVAVDFGIMGRIDRPTRRFLAETLYGFIARDYDRVADVHFEQGYVPASQSHKAFSLALRAIGEPIWGRPAEEMSIARLLTQLFDTTRQFEMVMQPSLIMLQKTMVVSEGVARSLDPKLSIWTTAKPVMEQWMTEELGPQARLRDAADTARVLARLAAKAPDILGDLEKASSMLHQMAGGDGLRLHAETVEALSKAQDRSRRRDFAGLAATVGAAAAVGIGIGALLAS